MEACVAILKELKQVIKFNVFMSVNLLYHEVNYMSAHYLMVENRDGTIKARFVAAVTNPDWKD